MTVLLATDMRLKPSVNSKNGNIVSQLVQAGQVRN